MNTQTKVFVAVAVAVAAMILLPSLVGASPLTGWGLFLLALVVIVPLAVMAIQMRDSLARGLNRSHEAWLNLNAELQRRHDLIARLLSNVGSHVTDEREVLAQLTLARNAAVASRGAPASRAKDENALTSALRRLLAIVDRYPDLKADDSFLKLQEALVNAENRLQSAVGIYNSSVRDYNNSLQAPRSSLVAGVFGFKPREFFHAEPAPEPRTPRAKLDHLPEKSTPPPAEESGPIPLGIVEPMPTESEPAVDMSARAVQEAPSLEVPQYPSEPRRFTRRTSPPAWPGWPSAFAGPDGPSC